jgi:hypothetical protein
METYDLFFTPATKPAVGTYVAIEAIRNASGAVVQWHAVVTAEQLANHKKAGKGKGFDAAKSTASKTALVKDKPGMEVATTVPVHVFFGRDIVDGDTGSRYSESGAVAAAVAPPPKKEGV